MVYGPLHNRVPIWITVRLRTPEALITLACGGVSKVQLVYKVLNSVEVNIGWPEIRDETKVELIPVSNFLRSIGRGGVLYVSGRLSPLSIVAVRKVPVSSVVLVVPGRWVGK